MRRQLEDAYGDSSPLGRVIPYLFLALALFALFVWRVAEVTGQ